MTHRPSGIAGTLFPERYITGPLTADARSIAQAPLARQLVQLERWWSRVETVCGPASGLRAIFDVVAMPLFGILRFRAHDAVFDRGRCEVRLSTPSGRSVGLLILPWTVRRTTAWRDLDTNARAYGATWGFVLAPPFLSLVDLRGHATRQAIEFSFPAVLEPARLEAFASLASATAFDPPAGMPAATCAIEWLVERAVTFQDAVRRDLQRGVIRALRALTPVITPSTRSAQDQALTLVYRLLFLLFAESRDLVPHQHPIYAQSYSLASLARDTAAPAAAVSLWDSLAAITRLSRRGCRSDDLIVRPFNGALFARAAAPSLESGGRRRSPLGQRRHDAMRDAVMALSSRPGPAGQERISFADLGVDQLGAVYEHLLDVTPNLRSTELLDGRRTRGPINLPPTSERSASDARGRAHSRARKQSATFYTPRALTEFVVRRTLAPLVAGISSDAILDLRVVDPAMGSGAFLVAACRYLAEAYERALVQEGRAEEDEIDEDARAGMRRLIAERCLAGVDRNPMAVQLASLSLWLTTLARGRPLSFLDHRLRAGDSLIGAAPEDVRRLPPRARSGSPEAFSGSESQLSLFDRVGLESSLRASVGSLLALAARRDETVADVHAKEQIWRQLTSPASALHRWRAACDLWCSRWFAAPNDVPTPAEHRALLDAVLNGDRTLPDARVNAFVAAARATAEAHGFFHWPLEFADVFYDARGEAKPRPGFDAVIGNPPWEMLRHESIAGGSDAAARIDRHRAGDPRQAIVHFIRSSGLYPSCGRGHLNLYQPFVDRALSLARMGGRVGLVVPWGLASDDGATALRARLLERDGVDTMIGLDNGKALFPIHRGVRFLALTAQTGRPAREVRARFGITSAEMLDELPGRDDNPRESPYPIRITPQLIQQLGGRCRRVPDARRDGDLALLKELTERFPPLAAASGWSATFSRELNGTDDRRSFRDDGDLPVIDGKHVTPFRTDVTRAPRRITQAAAERLLPDRRFELPRLAYRDVSAVSNRQSLIAAVVPAGVVTTHTLFCLRTPLPSDALYFLCALFNSFVLNTIVRMLMGGHVTTSLVEALPVPVWSGRAEERRIARLARALSRARPPIEIGARVQAAVARLYRLDAERFQYVVDGFPLVAAHEKQAAIDAFRRRP